MPQVSIKPYLAVRSRIRAFRKGRISYLLHGMACSGLGVFYYSLEVDFDNSKVYFLPGSTNEVFSAIRGSHNAKL